MRYLAILFSWVLRLHPNIMEVNGILCGAQKFGKSHSKNVMWTSISTVFRVTISSVESSVKENCWQRLHWTTTFPFTSIVFVCRQKSQKYTSQNLNTQTMWMTRYHLRWEHMLYVIWVIRAFKIVCRSLFMPIFRYNENVYVTIWMSIFFWE